MRPMTYPLPDALQALCGPIYPVTEDDIDWLQELVCDDLDSWFTSSLCCCDACYADFSRRWPGTARRDLAFQEGAIPLSAFLEGAKRVPRAFAPAQLSTLRHYVQCRRCLAYIEHNLWAFEHPFDGAEEFEDDLDVLEAVAHDTPFLLLEHDFPQRVLATIRRLAIAASAMPPPARLFRARNAAEVATMDVDAFGPPPAECVTEGRYNHAGNPMLYLADDEDTALAEIGQPGGKCSVAELTFGGTWKVLDLFDLNEEQHDAEAWPLLNLLARSALGAAPRTGGGWVRKEYAFTRFVGDCAKAAGFDAIRYGSTKGWGSNYVLLQPQADGRTAELLGTRVRCQSPLPPAK